MTHSVIFIQNTRPYSNQIKYLQSQLCYNILKKKKPPFSQINRAFNGQLAPPAKRVPSTILAGRSSSTCLLRLLTSRVKQNDK